MTNDHFYGDYQSVREVWDRPAGACINIFFWQVSARPALLFLRGSKFMWAADVLVCPLQLPWCRSGTDLPTFASISFSGRSLRDLPYCRLSISNYRSSQPRCRILTEPDLQAPAAVVDISSWLLSQYLRVAAGLVPAGGDATFRGETSSPPPYAHEGYHL